MHPRQRSPRGFYASSSEYRHLNRDSSFGRGHLNPKPFSHPPPPPPAPPPPPSSSSRRGGPPDIFVEAGRLAAEYLVSQGLLPPNVLSVKWHSNSFKKHGSGEILAEGGRTSALARLGNAVQAADGPSGRRKLGFDEFGQKGSRRRGSFRGNGLDWGGSREFRRNGSWSDSRSRATPDPRDSVDDDSVTRQKDDEQHQHQHQHQQQQVGVGGGDVNVSQKLDSNEVVPTSESGDSLDVETDRDRVSGELMDLKQSSSGAAKDACDVDTEVLKSSNDSENVSDEVKDVVTDVTCDDDDTNTEKSGVSKNLPVQRSDQESKASSSVVTDLLSLCKSVKVPTKTRSLRPYKNSKVDPHQNNEDENTHDGTGDLQGPEVLAENESVKGSSSGDLLSDKTYDLENIDSNIADVEPVNADTPENLKELDTSCSVEEDQSIGCQSGQDIVYMHDNNQESSATLPEYGSCSSMAEERGEKRVAEADDLREESKRLKESLPSLAPRTEGYFLHNNPIGMKESPGQDDISVISHIDKVTMTSDQGSLMSTSQFTDIGDRSFLHCSEEKQSLPSSFRTCDLNLIEASEVHENQVDHPILFYPSVSETKKTVPVDIDLTMSRSGVAGKFSTHASSGKEIEVIDLESDSPPPQEKSSIDNMETKSETMFPSLEGFPNHAQNTADIPDVQDGYGIMISELLGTDFPNCSSVPSDINSVHNEMGLHNGTGTLAEDDSIYMSLGEIPLSFLRSWEPPPSQDYQKPF